MAKPNPTENSITSKLLQACRKGKRKEQKELYEICAPKVLGIIYRYVQQYDMANEILQLTCIKMFNNLDQFKEGSFFSWIGRIAINTSLNELKRNRKYAQMDNIEDAEIHHTVNPFEDDSSDILKILKGMNQEDRILFNLRGIEGYSFKEIGEILEITEVNARVQYYRVRLKVKTKVEDLFLQ